MNKFKYVAGEELKQKPPVQVKDCSNCSNEACSRLQALAEIDMTGKPQEEVFKLYNFQIKHIKDKCEKFRTRTIWRMLRAATRTCDACNQDEASTVQREEIGSYLCDECYESTTQARRNMFFQHTNEERATAERITQVLEQQRHEQI